MLLRTVTICCLVSFNISAPAHPTPGSMRVFGDLYSTQVHNFRGVCECLGTNMVNVSELARAVTILSDPRADCVLR